METAGLAGHSGNRFDASLPVSDLTFWIWCPPDRAPHQPGSLNTSCSLLCFHPTCTRAVWMAWDRTPFRVGLGTPPQGRLWKKNVEIGQEYWQVPPDQLMNLKRPFNLSVSGQIEADDIFCSAWSSSKLCIYVFSLIFYGNKADLITLYMYPCLPTVVS